MKNVGMKKRINSRGPEVSKRDLFPLGTYAVCYRLGMKDALAAGVCRRQWGIVKLDHKRDVISSWNVEKLGKMSHVPMTIGESWKMYDADEREHMMMELEMETVSLRKKCDTMSRMIVELRQSLAKKEESWKHRFMRWLDAID